MKETLELTGKEGRSIIYEDNDEFEIVYERIVDTSRWCVEYEAVVKRIADGKFFKTGYRRGATEMQDEQPYEYGVAVFEEVFPVEKTVTVYE